VPRTSGIYRTPCSATLSRETLIALVSCVMTRRSRSVGIKVCSERALGYEAGHFSCMRDRGDEGDTLPSILAGVNSARDASRAAVPCLFA
jgi:hypothetical protein